jgi:ribosomal protein L7/L12
MNYNLEELISTSQKILTKGGSVEDVLLYLKERGCSKIACIKAIYLLQKVNLRQAKHIVHYSNVWQDVREQDEEFHQSLVSKCSHRTNRIDKRSTTQKK